MIKRKRAYEEDTGSGDSHRWIVSYADFITVMFCFFVVMFSISLFNETKFRQFFSKFNNIFNNQTKTTIPSEDIIPLFDSLTLTIDDQSKSKKPSSATQEKTSSRQSFTPPEKKSKSMVVISNRLGDQLGALINEDLVTIREGQSRIEVEISSNIFFKSGSAALSPRSIPIIRTLAGELVKIPNPVRVEGFTDNTPINNDYFPSNWELSATRAASVVRLLEKMGIEPHRLAVIGYGEHHSKIDNNTKEGRKQNRKVIIVIHADPAKIIGETKLEK